MSLPPGLKPLFFRRLMTPGLRASVQALFPENDLGAPDWRATNMVERALDLFAELPPHQRRLLTFLFLFVPFAPLVLFSSPLPFVWMSTARRTAQIRAWRSSSFFLRRAVGDGLKATLTMIYLSHPEPLRFMGVRGGCAHPTDAFALDEPPAARVA
jgi:hypothetical protein